MTGANSPPFEIASVLVRFDHVGRFIVNRITASRERLKNLAD
jgi:hypothetical protein